VLLAACHLTSRGAGTVYAFEPHPGAFEKLQINVDFNQFHIGGTGRPKGMSQKLALIR
jgi:hypothetical protein